MERLCQHFQESFREPNMPEELLQHVSTCESCQEFARKQEALRMILPSWQEPEFSPDFALKVMSRLAEESVTKPGVIESLSELVRFRISIPFPVGVLTSLFLIISVMLNLFFFAQNFQQNKVDSSPIIQQPVKIPVSLNSQSVSASTGFYNTSDEWIGPGAFLLIPIVKPNLNAYSQEEDEPKESQNI